MSDRSITVRCALSILVVAALLHATPVAAAELLSGPMLGPTAMREAQVWVQTDSAAEVVVRYREDGGELRTAGPATTRPDSGHTATLVLDRVEPGKRYQYTVVVDGTAVSGPHSFSTPEFYHERSPPPDLRVVVAGRHYVTEEGFEPPYRTLGGGYAIFSEMLAAQPDLVLWAGDTCHLRPSDWSSASGYFKRYSHARSVPELRKLLHGVPHHGVWSGSDYGPPEAGRHYTLRGAATRAFESFWPAAARAPGIGGLCSQFRVSDVEFFLLDVRSHRDTLVTAEKLPEILGDPQIEWLRRALNRSTATFKVVVAGMPLLNPASDNPENFSSAKQEQTRLLSMLREDGIEGLFFVAGGKPFGELTRLVQANSYDYHELTVGPVTALPVTARDELNFFRVPGTSSFERHFAVLEFAGGEDARTLTVSVRGISGEEFWKTTLTAASMVQP